MREFLTVLGIALCLALIAAMAGPHFIDWNSHRAFFEQRVSEITGQPARIEGQVRLTLLPTPSLSLHQVQIGARDAAGFTPFEAERIAGALSATALLRGDVVITEAYIDRPILRVGPEGLDTLRGKTVGRRGASAEAISVEKLQMRDGTLLIARPGREALTFSDIAGEMEATSLIGPAKGSATFVLDGVNRSVRAALGRVEGGKGRLKVLLEDLQLAMRLDVDGVLSHLDGTPDFDGALALTGNPTLDAADKVQLPLRSTAKARLRGTVLDLDDVALTLGAEPMPLTLAGTGKVTFRPHHSVDLVLSGRSYDFDRPGPDGKPQLAVPVELIGRLTALGGGASQSLPDGTIDLSVGGLIIGGQTVQGARIIAERRDGHVRIHQLEGALPGQTTLQFERDSLSRDELISGVARFESRDPERLHGWFNGAQRTTTAAASLSASAVLSTARSGLLIDRIEIDRGETHLSGQGSYFIAEPGLRPAPRLSLTLASPRLAIEDIPAYVVGADKREDKPELDFEIDVQAAKLVLEGRETGRLTARARRDGEIVSIERIEISELDGANLIASGTLGGGARRITVKLDADRVGGIAAIAEQVFPGAISTGLRRRAALLSPALVVASLANDDHDDSYTLTAEGRLASTALKLGGKLVSRNDINLDLSLQMDNADGVALGRQIVAGTQAGQSALPGFVRLSMKGGLRGAVLVGLETGLAGTSSRIDGHIRLFQPFSPFEGVMVGDVPDLAAAAPLLGMEAALLPAGGLKTSARVQGNLQQVTLVDLRAFVGDMPVQGEVAFRLAEQGKVAGQLRLPRIDFRALAGVALGPVRSFSADKGWSAASFGKPFALPLSGDLWIEADRGWLEDGLVLDEPKFVLRFDQQAISIEYSDARLASGRVSGDVFLKRIGVAAYASAKLAWKDLDLAKTWPGGAAGMMDGEVQLSGRGETLAKISQSLSGNGALRLRNLVIPSFDPAGLARLLAIPLDSIGAIDLSNISRRLEMELARGALEVADLKLTSVVIDGIARLGAVSVERPDIRFDVTGTYDLSQRQMDVRIGAAAARPPGEWSGALPQFAAQWRGPLAMPTRNLAVDGLVNGLLAVALNRDIARNEVLEQDIRERAFFNRRRKAAEEERLRIEALEAARVEEVRRAEQAKLAEQQRLAQEKAAEDAAAKIAEQQRLAKEKAAEDAAKLAEQQRIAKEKAEEAARRAASQQPVPPLVVPPASLRPPSGGMPPPPLDLMPPGVARP